MITLFYTEGNKDRSSHFWRLTLWGCTEQMGWVCSPHAFEVLECSVANLENKEVTSRILRKELVIVLVIRTMPNVIGIRVCIDHELVCVVLMSLSPAP